VVQRSYDLCAAIYEHVNRFPRAQRGLLGRVVIDDALRMLALLTVANRLRERSGSLAEASGRLDAVRIALRLSHQLGFLSHGGYELLSLRADEVGRMLGGWIKHVGATGAPAEPPAAIATAATAAKRQGGSRYTMTSPTIEKYLRAKLDHPSTLVVVGVGAFYQTFFEDAAWCARELGFMLRDLAADSEPERIPACGFPRGRLDHYREVLASRGRTVHAV
jgi:hypothetical protein